MRTTLITFFLFALLSDAIAQDERTLEYLRQEEQRKKAQVMRELDSGVYFLDLGKYQAADVKFRYVLANVKSVPSDLTFYFGKNSYHLGHYKQSIDWLMKYIQLKGTEGQFSEEAASILKQSEDKLLSQRTEESRKATEVLSKNYDIDCGAGAKVSCPVCKGDHVIVKKGPFGDQYRTCPYCDDHGLLTCAEYNMLLKGQLEQKN